MDLFLNLLKNVNICLHRSVSLCLMCILQEMREFWSNDVHTLSSRAGQYFREGWNRFDVLIIVTFITAFIMRFVLSGANFIFARIMMCFNFNLYFFRILSVFSASKQLGPVVTMLQGMVSHVLQENVYSFFYIHH